jgi:hypothetical protein
MITVFKGRTGVFLKNGFQVIIPGNTGRDTRVDKSWI